MATESFDKTFVVTNPEAIKKVIAIAESETDIDSPSEKVFSQEERERSDILLKHCLSHLKL